MHKVHLIFISLILSFNLLAIDTTSLKVGAYNLKNFGTTKVENTFVLGHLVQILARYDVALLQEIRNKDEVAIYLLRDALSLYTGINYQIIISEPIGRSTYKEQYAYLYNPKKVTLLTHYLYDDGLEPFEDTFSREPFIAYFEEKSSLQRFVAVGAHIAPADVIQELNEMPKVYQDIQTKLHEENVVVMGDLNADCRYLDPAEELELLLKKDPRFTWHIERGVDTTTEENTFCAYDRIITAGPIFNNVLSAETGVYNVAEIFGLDADTANLISDHYPVEITFSF